MQLKALTTLLLTTSLPLLTAAAPLSSFSNAADADTAALEDIQALKTDLHKLDTAVQNWDGELTSAMPMKTDATNAQEDIDKALKDAKDIDSLSPDTKEELAKAMRQLKPEAEGALKHLVEKEPQFQKSGLTAPIGQNLQKLKGSLGQVEDSFKSRVSGQDAQELSQASKDIGGELDKAIKVFS